jgi:TPP-dependent pyruvate/acetoin dehydrogenase alpha subunit
MVQDANILKELYFKMLRIRYIEEKIAELYPEQEMRCPVHLSIGQEAVAVGACHALKTSDIVLSNHRAHAHYLAKGGDLKSMIAEIYLRADGCCGGRGGSMHLNDPSVGLLGSVPIVGAPIPLAVGTAFKAYLKGEATVSMVFLGEAASEEGAFYESVNFAVLHKLPMIFLCENNLYSVYSPLSVRIPEARNLLKLVEAMGAKGMCGDGNDVVEVYTKTNDAVTVARKGEGPVFLEFATYRWREHCGPNFDNHIGYRTEEEFDLWKARDPLARFRNQLESKGIISEADVEDMVLHINQEIEEAFEFAQNSSFPDPSTINQGVYAD